MTADFTRSSVNTASFDIHSLSYRRVSSSPHTGRRGRRGHDTEDEDVDGDADGLDQRRASSVSSFRSSRTSIKSGSDQNRYAYSMFTWAIFVMYPLLVCSNFVCIGFALECIQFI